VIADNTSKQSWQDTQPVVPTITAYIERDLQQESQNLDKALRPITERIKREYHAEEDAKAAAARTELPAIQAREAALERLAAPVVAIENEINALVLQLRKKRGELADLQSENSRQQEAVERDMISVRRRMTPAYLGTHGRYFLRDHLEHNRTARRDAVHGSQQYAALYASYVVLQKAESDLSGICGGTHDVPADLRAWLDGKIVEAEQAGVAAAIEWDRTQPEREKSAKRRNSWLPW
jgi:DNA repair exonuclease SbcCD ATPase subunit